MRVKMLEDVRLKTGPRSTKRCPKDAIVVVDDAVGAEWIASGQAEIISEPGAPALTEQETVVLKAAANQIMQQQREALASLDFRPMTVADLKAVAAELQLPLDSRARKDQIIAALEWKRDEVLGADWREGDTV